MKDELKKTYKIKWDADKKLWYYEGEKIIDGLKKYTIKKIDIDYDDKDEYKLNYKSLKWDAKIKTWLCSLEDYNKIYTIRDDEDITSLTRN